MTYPESAAVSAGDATLASHYNNLRADAVHLGQAAADAVSLGTLLERYVTRLEVERLDTTKIRVPATATAPVSVLIDGYPCQAIANVDLDAGEVPSGGASAFYIFANRVGASTTFTLTVSASSTEAANQRRIGRFYWDGTKIIKDSVRSELADLVADLLYFVDPQVCNGRLTLSTGVPAPDSDISSSANVYFTPYFGNRVALYVQDYGWRVYSFSELTLDVSGIADAKIIDVWMYDNAGTLTLAYTEWSNDTLRAAALVRQDGVLCKTGALGYRYLGSVRTSGAGVTCSTDLKRFCINFYNQVPLKLEVRDSTSSWTYGTSDLRQMRDQSANKVEFIIGVSEYPVRAISSVKVDCAAGEGGHIAIGLDTVTSISSDSMDAVLVSVDGRTLLNLCTFYNGFPGIGYHYLAPLETVDAGDTVDFYGANYQLFEGVIYG